jgi:hypothetical protein
MAIIFLELSYVINTTNHGNESSRQSPHICVEIATFKVILFENGCLTEVNQDYFLPIDVPSPLPQISLKHVQFIVEVVDCFRHLDRPPDELIFFQLRFILRLPLFSQIFSERFDSVGRPLHDEIHTHVFFFGAIFAEEFHGSGVVQLLEYGFFNRKQAFT